MADADEGTGALAEAVVRGDRRALARAITLVESERPEDAPLATELLAALLPRSGQGVRVGITGPPGAGKSTLIDVLGRKLIARGERVAVLAVDPSSPIGGGSILGDKTRMARLAAEPASFIRPSPSRGAAGGIGPHTAETLVLCEAAGHSVVLIETLGTGQGEHAVAELADAVILVLVAGGGDEVTGMKRGAIELADVVAVNKADGEGLRAAESAATDVEGALGLLSRATGSPAPRVVRVSALEERGIEELWSATEAALIAARASGALAARRAAGMKHAFATELERALRTELGRPDLVRVRADLEGQVLRGELTPRSAAERLLAQARKS